MNKIGEDFDFQEVYNESIHLQEMARPWTEIAKAIDDLRVIRHAHLIKLFYYKGQTHYAENFDGWVASARKGFDDVPKVKGTNKYPDFGKLYNLVWESIEDSFDDFHKRTVKDLNTAYTDFEKIENVDLDGVRNFVSAYNNWACGIITKEGGITYTDTVDKIKELLGLE